MNVAVVCRAKAFEETRLKVGWWSYPVYGIDWNFFPVEDGQVINKDYLAAQGYDAIVWEDWCWNTWEGKSAIPVFAVIVDSNTSPRRHKRYLGRAAEADVLLIEQDHLKDFKALGKPTYRWTYGVNERVFAPLQKTVDIAYHVSRTPERSALADYLLAWISGKPYSMTKGGGLSITQYAERLAQARIVVHRRTHEQCRSHRFFDALAAGACLITDKGWQVAEDGFRTGIHYLEWESPAHLVTEIERVLDNGEWVRYANSGQAFVLSRHRWAHRAQELLSIMEDYR